MVFYSLDPGADGGIYYVAHPIEQMGHHLSMLAYDMNAEPVSYGHGAPLRLRNELQHGFRHVKWLKGIESVAHYSELSSRYGGTTKTTNSSGVTRPFSERWKWRRYYGRDGGCG